MTRIRHGAMSGDAKAPQKCHPARATGIASDYSLPPGIVDGAIVFVEVL